MEIAGQRLSVGSMGCVYQEQQQVLDLSSCLLKVDDLGKIKLEEWKGEKESRNTLESTMKRFKDRVKVGEESGEAREKAHSTEKGGQRRQIMICPCTYPETGTSKGRASCTYGHCTGEGVLLWVLSVHSVSRKAVSRASEALHKAASSSCKVAISLTAKSV